MLSVLSVSTCVCRCWLSIETGLIWAFVVPALIIICVRSLLIVLYVCLYVCLSVCLCLRVLLFSCLVLSVPLQESVLVSCSILFVFLRNYRRDGDYECWFVCHDNSNSCGRISMKFWQGWMCDQHILTVD